MKKAINQKGQIIYNVANFLVIILVGGILLYAFASPIATVWDLNSNAPNYAIARTLVDLYPLLIVISIIAIFWLRQSFTPAQG